MLLVFFLIVMVSSKMKTNELGVGQKANDFNLKNVDGKMVSLKSMKDAKGYVVVFTCNSCPVAQAYESRIIDLHNKYAEMGYPVVAINPNCAEKKPADSYDKMKVRAEEKNYPFVYLHDETQEVAKSFGATRTPHIYILDKSLTVKYVGAIDNNQYDASEADKKYVEDAIDELLKGKKVSNDHTTAVGCTIKWKD